MLFFSLSKEEIDIFASASALVLAPNFSKYNAELFYLTWSNPRVLSINFHCVHFDCLELPYPYPSFPLSTLHITLFFIFYSEHKQRDYQE